MDSGISSPDRELLGFPIAGVTQRSGRDPMKIATATLVASFALLAACAMQEQPTAAATIYFGGDILTMEGDTPTYAESVAVKDGRISFVGSKAEALKQQGPGTMLVDLQGKTLLPGFIDPHLHPILGSVILNTKFASPFDWTFPWGKAKAVRGNQAFMTKVIEYSNALDNPTEPLVIWGYMEPFHGAMSRQALDGVSTTRPIIIWQYSAHEVYFNTAALDFYKLTEAETKGNRQIDWKLGRYWEAGFFSVALPKLAPSLMGKEAMQAGLERFRAVTHQGGVTTVGDMATGSSGDLDGDVSLMSAALENADTPFRVQLTPDANTLGLQLGDGDMAIAFVKGLPKRNSPHLAFGNNIKLFSDGAFFGQAMQLEAPGYRDGHHGDWIMPPERLRSTMKLWWEQGYTIHIHCNGGLGLAVILDALEMLQKESPRQDHRLTIEHFGVSSAEQVKRLAALGAVVSANPYYMYSMADKYAEGNLDPKRASEIVRAGSLLASRVPFAFHSDFTMAPIQPLLLAWIAVNRVTAEGTVMAPDQRIPVYNALQAITSNAAFILRMDEQTGSIRAGKSADFVVLAQNPLKVDPMQIKDIRILETVYEGRSFPIQ
jgi:predicted amidohydrolase YtcJ